MITKKNIVAIADAIKKIPVYDMDGNEVKWSGDDIPQGGDFLNMNPNDVVRVFADMLEKQNPQFKRQLFMDYIAGKVGPNGGKN